MRVTKEQLRAERDDLERENVRLVNNESAHRALIETRDESLDALENEVERLSRIIDNDAECLISLENEVGHCRDGIEALTALVDAMTGTLRWITKEDQEYGD